jgi:hypothetical protein
MPALFRKLRHHYAPLVILAGASVLAACGPKANQAAASDQLHQAGSDLKAAAAETADAVNTEAEAAKPGLKQLARDTDRSAAALTSAAGDAAANAGGAIAKAGRRADIAAQRSAAAARARADNAQN